MYQDSQFGIPAIYLNDWPDRYIHTNFDSAANIDPTKLKRAAFIGAASGYFLAGLDVEQSRRWFEGIGPVWKERIIDGEKRAAQLSEPERDNTQTRWLFQGSLQAYALQRFVQDPKINEFLRIQAENLPSTKKASGDGLLKFARKSEPKGPLAVFGYGYFADHAKAAGIATPKLLSYEGLWGAGEEYAYEVLNLAGGERNAQQIRDAVSAEYGPVPLEIVVEYLKALEKIGIVEAVKQ